MPTKDLRRAQLDRQPIRHKLNVLAHHLCVHANQGTRQRIADELLLQLHRLLDDLVNRVLQHLGIQRVKQGHGKLRVKSLIARDELVGERQARKETALLQPKDGTEGTREEDALHTGKAHQPRCKGLVRPHPVQRPLCLLADTRDGFNGIEQLFLFVLVLDIRINQERVRLRVNPLHRILEGVKELHHLGIHFTLKTGDKILHHDPIRSSKERQHTSNKMLLIRGQLCPVGLILAEVNLVRCPKHGDALLVHLVEVLL